MMRNVSCPVRRGADGKGPGHRNLASRLPYNLIAQLKGGREGAGDAGGRPGEQLGVHGDGEPGVEPEGVERPWCCPSAAGWAEKYRAEKRSLLRMEFSTFCVAMIQVPCQIVRTARRIVYRLLSWNPWQGVFLRLVERLHVGGCVDEEIP